MNKPLSPSHAVVSIERCDDYERSRVESAIARLLEPLGGMGAFVRPGQTVLLKPNLIVPVRADAAVTTHPEIVRAVAREALLAGASNVQVGDSPAFSSTRGVARKCGLTDALESLGVEIIDLARRPRPTVIAEDGPFRQVSFGAAALEADVLINLPKIKTHKQMGMSLGLKNLFGAVAGKRKALLHFRNGPDHDQFGELIVAIARRLAPALTIEDGVWALERNGPTSGDPRRARLLVASADATAADRVALEALGVPPESVPYMRAAIRMGHGVAALDAIRLVGVPLDTLRLEGYVGIRKLAPIDFSLPQVIGSLMRQIVMLAQAQVSRPKK